VDLIAQKAAGGFQRASASAIKTFEHEGGPIKIAVGRFGPYANQGKVYANIPKDTKPEDVTLEQAIALIAAKIEAGGGKKKKAPAKKATAKKPAAKKAAAGEKKPAAKKAPAKKAAAKKPVDSEDVPF
jgi:DNA topoisomerase-1